MSHSPADVLAPGAISALVLLGFRISGLMLIAPVFASRTVPVSVRTVLVVLLTWLLAPVVTATGGAAPQVTPATAVSEALIGFAIGLGAAVLIAAVEMSGELIAIQTGLSGAASLDPLTYQSIPVIGQFTGLFAIAVLLSADAHIMMLDAVASSLRVLPVGGTIHGQAGIAAMLSAGSTLFMLGLRFAAPVIVAVLLANSALAVLSRAAPQLNVLSVAFPLQIALGLAALAASLPLIATFFNGWYTVYDGLLTHFFGAFARGGG